MITLQQFAGHVAHICVAVEGDVFTLAPGYEIRAEIEIKQGGHAFVNGRWEGNRHGAVAAYAALVGRFLKVAEVGNLALVHDEKGGDA